tara:strand:- start:985 stop:1416 length:432 start_codon:yes stop_codon:yes gene_type:complete
MLKATRHTGLVVTDIDRSISFYEALGLRVWNHETEQGSFISHVVGLSGAVIETAKLKLPDSSLLELLEYKSHPSKRPDGLYPANHHGCSHIAFTVENVEETVNEVVKLGGTLVNAPAISENGKAKVSYCYDLDGILMEIVEEL